MKKKNLAGIGQSIKRLPGGSDMARAAMRLTGESEGTCNTYASAKRK